MYSVSSVLVFFFSVFTSILRIIRNILHQMQALTFLHLQMNNSQREAALLPIIPDSSSPKATCKWYSYRRFNSTQSCKKKKVSLTEGKVEGVVWQWLQSEELLLLSGSKATNLLQSFAATLWSYYSNAANADKTHTRWGPLNGNLF